MRLTLRIENQPALSNGQPVVKVLEGAGIQIGRAAYADWQLPDPRKVISSEHALIQLRDGAYVLCDRSTNGTYLNGERVEAANREVWLSDGDHIAIGHYELSVRIERTEPQSAPREPQPPPANSAADTDRRNVAAALPEREAAEDHRAPMDSASDAAAAFVRGLGLDIGSDPRGFEQAGQTLRVLVLGLFDLLKRQGNIKSLLGVERTTVRLSDNNIFKFSSSPEDAIARIFAPRAGDLPGPTAAERSLEDIRKHEERLLTAINDAVRRIVEKLSPQEIKRRETGGVMDKLTPGRQRANWWDELEREHAALLENDGAKLDELIEEELRGAFTRHL